MAVFVQNSDKLVYRVDLELRNTMDYFFLINLELVAGWDYINPDESNAQGYVSPDRFVEDVQYESITFYPLMETMTERLREEGYERVLPENLSIEHLVSTV